MADSYQPVSLQCSLAASKCQEPATDCCPDMLPMTDAFGPGDPGLRIDSSHDIWAADCPVDDVDKLLDWAGDPSSADRDLMDPLGFEPVHHFALCHGQSDCDSQALMLSRQASENDISNSTNSCMTAQSCISNLGASPAGQNCLDLPMAEAQQSLTYDPADSTSPTLSSATGLEADPLDVLLEDHQAASMDSAWGTMDFSNQAPPATLCTSREALHGLSDGSAKQESQKKRCGRPRVYDLDTPVPPGDLFKTCQEFSFVSKPFQCS